MLVVFPYSPVDQAVAAGLAQWICELGQNPKHKCLVVRDCECDPLRDAEIKASLEASFASVEVIDALPDGWHKWPESCNMMWQRAARHIMLAPEPWLWIEPDVVPLVALWINLLEEEYQKAGRPFMGDYVDVNDVVPHMSGVAIYPGDILAHAGIALITSEVAWDCAAADQIVPRMHVTVQIEHSWKHPTFESYEQFTREVSPQTVLYHSSKDGSLIRLLREHRGERPPTPRQTSESCSIFIKSYPPDYPWLEYCLRSIQQFGSGFKETVVAYPKGVAAPPVFFPWVRLVQVAETSSDGYLEQQRIKMHADEYCDTDYICHIDCDTIFTKQITPQTFFEDGKPVWMMTPMEQVHADTNHAWRSVMQKFFGTEPTFEYMRRFPFVVPSWAYKALRDFCEEKHGVALDQYIFSQPYREFSEFNILGSFLHQRYRDKFHWVNTSLTPENKWPALTVDQRWSVGGLTDDIKAAWEKILGTPETGTAETSISFGGQSSSNGMSKQQMAAAKAREALAAKRAAGLVVRKKRRKRPIKKLAFHSSCA